MNFKEFKTEMVSRCKSKSACTTEFKRVLDSENYKELITVLTDNFSWSCNNKIIDIELLEKVGNKTLNKYDLAINVTVIKGFLLVDNATVEAWGSATVEARDSATVEAGGNATVKAWDNAYINSFNTTEHKLSNKAICRYYYENKIILSKDSEIEKY